MDWRRYLDIEKVRGFRRRLPVSAPRLIRRSPEARRIDWHTQRALFWNRPWWFRLAAVGLGEALWAVDVVPETVRVVRRNAPKIAHLSPKTKGRQLVEALLLGLQNVHPGRYYGRDFWDPARARAGEDFLFDGTIQQLIGYANRKGDTEALNDKARFDRVCKEHGIPTPPLFAELRDGEVVWVVGDGLPPVDLFFKPVRGNQSRGVERWDRTSGGEYARIDNSKEAPRRLGGPALLRRFSERSRSTPYLMQERLKNHRALEPLSDGNLVVVRLLTLRTRTGAPEAFRAIVRLPHSRGTTEWWWDNNLVAAVDVDSGVVSSPAFRIGIGNETVLLHPDTGNAIAGSSIPLWDDAVAVALRAHRILGQLACVGWDLAIAETGPVLLEGNNGPGLEIHQLAEASGLAVRAFSDALLGHASGRNRARCRRRRTF